MSTRYAVEARPWEHGWELHVADVGVTQVRVLRKARQQVRDLVSTITDRPCTVPDEAITIRYQLGGLEQEAAEAGRRTEAAARLQIDAAEATRRVVADLRARGVSVSDIAEILGRSRGRISQLLAD